MQPLNLEQVSTRIGQLPSLPAVVTELLESFEDEHANAGAIAHKIAQDQALAAKVLRVANSSFYGLRGKVVTVQDAMVVLGFRNVRPLVMAAGVTGGSKWRARPARELRSRCTCRCDNRPRRPSRL